MPELYIESYEEIKDFVKGTCAEDAPIIPVSAQQGANIDILIEAMLKKIWRHALKARAKNKDGGGKKHAVARRFD